ncbi:MAG TPA: DinB family protein [Candidatus Saccharimonadales bacterium]|jgi:DinB superfamily|nr:DinB family protein [Candidatus Saccharimonadales bacterium]
MKTDDLRYDDDVAFTLADDAATISAIVRRTPDERLRAVKIGDWTAKEVIGHLADLAEVFAERVRRCVAEDRPALPSVDQDAVHAERNNNDADAMALSKRLQAAHSTIVQTLQRPGAPDRIGVHAERGPVTAGWIAAYQARHSHEHVTELQPHFAPR